MGAGLIVRSSRESSSQINAVFRPDVGHLWFGAISWHSGYYAVAHRADLSEPKLRSRARATLSRQIWAEARLRPAGRPRTAVQSWGRGSAYAACGVTTSPQAYRADPAVMFQAVGLPASRHVLGLDVGVNTPAARRVCVRLAYTAQYRGGQMRHEVWLWMRIVFIR